MAANRPEEIHAAFTTAFNDGNLEALIALYEPEASIAPAPGEVVTGTAAIRSVLAGFLALKGRMAITTTRVVAAEDVALLHGTWTLTGTDQDGKAVELAGRNTEVVRRQSDGTWRFAIDNPFTDA